MRIQNSNKTIPVALALAAIFSTAATSAAHANGFAADTSKLPNASKIYRAPLQMQIVDTSPQVTDTRHPQENTVYQINVPPMPQSTTNVVQIGGPAQAGGNQAGNANTVPILHNSLPFAGPTSNISPHQSMANRLPNGTSTTGLTGTLAKKPPQTSPVANSAPMAKPLSIPHPPSVATYPSTTSNSTVSQSTSANTHVVGSLLHPQKEK